jgi:hypothetical protein
MEIKVKLKLKEGIEVELSENESKDLYQLLKKLHEDKIIYTPIYIYDWIQSQQWIVNKPYFEVCNKTNNTKATISYNIK